MSYATTVQYAQSSPTCYSPQIISEYSGRAAKLEAARATLPASFRPYLPTDSESNAIARQIPISLYTPENMKQLRRLIGQPIYVQFRADKTTRRGIGSFTSRNDADRFNIYLRFKTVRL